MNQGVVALGGQGHLLHLNTFHKGFTQQWLLLLANGCLGEQSPFSSVISHDCVCKPVLLYSSPSHSSLITVTFISLISANVTMTDME